MYGKRDAVQPGMNGARDVMFEKFTVRKATTNSAGAWIVLDVSLCSINKKLSSLWLIES